MTVTRRSTRFRPSRVRSHAVTASRSILGPASTSRSASQRSTDSGAGDMAGSLARDPGGPALRARRRRSAGPGDSGGPLAGLRRLAPAARLDRSAGPDVAGLVVGGLHALADL